MSDETTRGLKRLGIIFAFVFLSVVATNALTDAIAPWIPMLANPLLQAIFVILVLSVMLLVLLRKTKSGRDVVLGRFTVVRIVVCRVKAVTRLLVLPHCKAFVVGW